MIDPKDLRIGNFVIIKTRSLLDNNYGIVTGISDEGVTVPKNTGIIPFNMLYGAPLTSPFGGLLPDSISFAECFHLWINRTVGIIEIEQYGEGRERLRHIENVHQVQNLHYDLTGTELKVNL